jgi:hypothetical protein
MKNIHLIPTSIKTYYFARSRRPLHHISRRAFAMATPALKEPRRFAPLKEGAEKIVEGVAKLKGVVFDVDGTLWFV